MIKLTLYSRFIYHGNKIYHTFVLSNKNIMGKENIKTKLVAEKLQFIADLGRTSAWITRRYTKFLKPYGISTQQLNILRVLRTTKDWTAMHKVNELLIIKSPNITRLADKLVTNKLINRNRSSDDRRIVFIKITNLGLKLLLQFDKEHEGELSSYMDTFTKEEAMLMTKILSRIRN